MSEIVSVRWPFTFHTGGIKGAPYWCFGFATESDDFDSYHYCDAMGWRTFEVLSRHQPSPKHMERVFCRSRIYDPLGRPVGSAKLQIFTSSKFDKLKSGRNYLPVDLDDEYESKAAERYKIIERFIVPPKGTSP